MNRRMFYKIKNSKGFTLIEVIVSLLVAAILGAMLVAFMGTKVTSANPVILSQSGAYLSSVMENMTADYRKQMSAAAKSSNTPAQGLNNFISDVGGENATSTFYGNNSYTVVENHRVSFDSSNQEQSAPSGKTLKVTIQYKNLSATALFTE